MRHSPFSSSFVMKAPMIPWIWLLTKNPSQGCQTPVYMAVEPDLEETTGKYFVYDIGIDLLLFFLNSHSYLQGLHGDKNGRQSARLSAD
jgi:hypothetical protein